MDLVSYVKMVDYYNNKYGLYGWKFCVSWNKEGVQGRGKGRIGVTHHDEKRVILDGYFILYNKRVWVREILLHEIAHVLDPRDGMALTNEQAHDKVFSLTCMQLGAVWWLDELRFYESLNTPLREFLFKTDPVI